MTPIAAIGTDPMMAMNAKNRMAKAGMLEGARVPRLSRTPIPADLPSVGLTLKVAVAPILAPPQPAPGSRAGGRRRGSSARGAQDRSGRQRERVARGLRGKIQRLGRPARVGRQLAQQHQEKTLKLEYKARPLDGIWATAPYLHNGSVPNLAELLKPENQRPSKFFRRHALLRSQERRLHHAADAGRVRVRHVEAGQPQHRTRPVPCARRRRAARVHRTPNARRWWST
jgi:hypothetical protein